MRKAYRRSAQLPVLSCFSSKAVKVTCKHGKDDFSFKNPPSKVGSPFLVYDVTSREKSTLTAAG